MPVVVVSLGAGIAGVAGSFAAAGSTPSFVAAPVAGVLSRNLPAWVVTDAIVVLGDLGQKLNALAALVLAAILLGAASGGGMLAARLLDRWSGRDRRDPFSRVALSGLFVILVTGVISGALVPSLAAGAASALVHATAAISPALPAISGLSTGPDADDGDRADRADDGDREDDVDGPTVGNRRGVLASIAGTIGVGILGYLLGSRRTPGHGNPERLDLGQSEHEEIDQLLAEADRLSLDVEGLEPLVTETFYEVDINTTNPNLNASEWTLSVTGAVREDVNFTYEDLRSFEPEHRFVSLRCVGEQLNGRKMDTALWTGVPVMDLLDSAGLELDECCVMLRAADEYYEEFPIGALRDGFLAFGMNGRVLPRGHGFPFRALVPGHWGEINVKWLTEIEVLAAEQQGYWEERGWHGTGPVNTVAKLHVLDRLGGRIRVAGHAYAGTRGVSAVEVSTDGGESWRDATLSDPLQGEDVWRQWSFEYDTPGDTHEVVVRAIDGTGSVQPEQESGPFPRGPSGWVSTMIRS